MDSWVKGNSLRSMVEGPLTPREANLTIGEIFQDDKSLGKRGIDEEMKKGDWKN